MRKISLVLVISVSFVAGTLVTGNFVFADPEDGQNNLLEQILEAIQGINQGPIFVDALLVPQTVTCPDSNEPAQTYHPTRILWAERSNLIGALSPIEIRDQQVGHSLRAQFSNGEVTETDYTLFGAVSENTLCTGITIPSSATLTGDCGLGTTATLTTEEGFSATLNTDAVCG